MTYQEIQKYKLPYIYNIDISIERIHGYWYNDGDRLILATDSNLLNLSFNMDGTYTADKKHIYESIATHYIYDGKEWHLGEIEFIGGDTVIVIPDEKINLRES